ncbi:MAG: sigma-70 family RNA polymerase sigma factor [Acidobacteriales bacterium]|nr:sigma-70 family RNA polymerase sigma factor [Terriglobales bacterium]
MDGAAPLDELTQLLDGWMKGDTAALKSLVPVVYRELHRIAHQRLRSNREDCTLQTTALVHEAYLRLSQSPPRFIHDRRHFFALAGSVMRHVLVDCARENLACKRNGGIKLELEPEMIHITAPDLDLLALDHALNKLARADRRQAQIVELRFFAGLSIDDISDVLGVSPATVKRHWTTARAWLQHEISSRSANAGREQ